MNAEPLPGSVTIDRAECKNCHHRIKLIRGGEQVWVHMDGSTECEAP